MYSVDAQPFECKSHKRQINPYQRTAGNVSDGDGKLWRLATAGGDKKVRVRLMLRRQKSTRKLMRDDATFRRAKDLAGYP